MKADVCIITEASYPFVSGGVSTCVHQLITNCQELSFSILYLGASQKTLATLKYSLPANVVAIDTLWLFDQHPAESSSIPALTSADILAMKRLSDLVSDTDHSGKGLNPKDFIEILDEFFSKDFRAEKYWLRRCRTSLLWDLSVMSSQRFFDKMPFANYYYQFCSRVLPIIRILSADFPQASMYYAVTTGYAGIAGVAAKHQHGTQLMLTEHGIYPRERRLDLWDRTWVDSQSKYFTDPQSLSYAREEWIRYFDRLSLIAYQHSDIITTLFEDYVKEQVKFGADPLKCVAVANGMSAKLTGVRSKLGPWKGFSAGSPFRVSIIGRVTPVKDIKTFISAMLGCLAEESLIQARIFGPLVEDPAYVYECQKMIEYSGQSDSIQIVGPHAIQAILEQTDLVVMTSISEGQPMVLLEAGFAGIPSVVTDVGGCKAIIEGDSADDKKIGMAGIVTGMGDPQATAAAILRIARDPELWLQFSVAAQERAKLFYDEMRTMDEYKKLFAQCLHG